MLKDISSFIRLVLPSVTLGPFCSIIATGVERDNPSNKSSISPTIISSRNLYSVAWGKDSNITQVVDESLFIFGFSELVQGITSSWGLYSSKYSVQCLLSDWIKPVERKGTIEERVEEFQLL